MKFISKSTAETEKFAEGLASEYPAPCIFCLRGDLGVGKTAFTRGLARGYGFEGRVCSPTFAIMNVYSGKNTVNHFDLYRIKSDEELDDIGFEEYLGRDISVIEWPDEFMHLIHGAVEVSIEKTENEDERIISVVEQRG